MRLCQAKAARIFIEQFALRSSGPHRGFGFIVERSTIPVDEKYYEDLIYSPDEKHKIAKEGISLFASSGSLQ